MVPSDCNVIQNIRRQQTNYNNNKKSDCFSWKTCCSASSYVLLLTSLLSFSYINLFAIAKNWDGNCCLAVKRGKTGVSGGELLAGSTFILIFDDFAFEFIHNIIYIILYIGKFSL